MSPHYGQGLNEPDITRGESLIIQTLREMNERQKHTYEVLASLTKEIIRENKRKNDARAKRKQ